jgi:hypothetical protein
MTNQQAYICRRVVDALLREDVRQTVSRGRIVPAADMPFPTCRLISSGPTPSYWSRS